MLKNYRRSSSESFLLVLFLSSLLFARLLDCKLFGRIYSTVLNKHCSKFEKKIKIKQNKLTYIDLCRVHASDNLWLIDSYNRGMIEQHPSRYQFFLYKKAHNMFINK